MGFFGKKKAPAGPDFWTLDKINKDVSRAGYPPDCEWQTHFKGERLRAMGLEPQKVYVATETQDPNRDEPNHVVLRMGDWILDNREPRPYPYSSMGRRYKEYPGYETVPGTKAFGK
jgi:predicted transglutaminase-like cysteine proteinase